ncbi:MAG: hypothetical protein IPN06_08695 [Burkholderiales bacterium]|nr:hypothetical protein [Burkholderiales bacterium]
MDDSASAQIHCHVENDLGRLPNFGEKILRVPLDQDYPYWVEDENFNIDYRSPHPYPNRVIGGSFWHIQSSRIPARPLDLHRPLAKCM